MTLWRFTGQAHYLGAIEAQDVAARIVLTISVQHRASVERVFDSGGQWDVLAPDIAYLAGLVDSAERVDERDSSWFRLIIRGVEWWGPLMSGESRLSADQGVGLTLQNSWFVPLYSPSAVEYVGPSFLGYLGSIQGMRFAVDPATNTRAFGGLNEGGCVFRNPPRLGAGALCARLQKFACASVVC